jgi:hypothetical protein
MTSSRSEYTKTPPQTGGCSYFVIEKSPKTSYFLIEKSPKTTFFDENL